MADDFLYKRESYLIRGSFFEIYKKFRSNYKESIYHNALFIDLKEKGFECEKDKKINVYYKNKKVGAYVPDLIINDKILIELKAKPLIIKQDRQQFWYYLRGSKYRLGFLVNFGNPRGVEIIRSIYDKARGKTTSA